jgi:hypothetical protein
MFGYFVEKKSALYLYTMQPRGSCPIRIRSIIKAKPSALAKHHCKVEDSDVYFWQMGPTFIVKNI